MEVGLPFLGLVGDAGGLQVGSDCLGGLVMERKNGTPTRLVGKPEAKFARQGQRDRLVLGATSTEKHARVASIEAE
jgi:hypothetical protein